MAGSGESAGWGGGGRVSSPAFMNPTNGQVDAVEPTPGAVPAGDSLRHAPLPHYTTQLIGFQILNAVNFTIALGAPMVLVAKLLGAGEAVIGVLLSLTSLLTILQLPAANLADRLGYKRLMMAGWRSRAYALLLMAPLPLLAGHVPGGVLLTAMIALMLAFNIIRGFASSAWYPWLTQLVPEAQRGRYLGRENLMINIGVFATQALAGWFLGRAPPAWHYSVLFVLSFAAGWYSVRFFEDVPCHVPAHAHRPSGGGWRAARRAMANRAFRDVTVYATIIGFAVAAVPGFLVVYLRDALDFSEGLIVYLAAASTVGSLLTAPFAGRLLDAVGSRPVMRLGGLGLVAVLVFWTLGALHLYRIPPAAAAIAFLLWGSWATAHGLAHLRLTLALCPREDLTMGMAVNQVFGSLSCGAASVLWGLALEHLRGTAHAAMPGTAFVVFFAACAMLAIGAQAILSRLHEPTALTAMALIAQVLRDGPARVVSALGFRGPRDEA